MCIRDRLYSIHGWSFHNDQQGFVKKIRTYGERFLTSRSDINISVSESNKQSGQAVIPGFKSLVINNGIDPVSYTHLDVYKRQDKGQHDVSGYTHSAHGLSLIHI